MMLVGAGGGAASVLLAQGGYQVADTWSVGLALTYFRKRSAPLIVGFAVSAFAHGFYDVCMTIEDVGPALGAAIILALWVWAIRVTPRLVGLPH